jgi:hypothetical protein
VFDAENIAVRGREGSPPRLQSGDEIDGLHSIEGGHSELGEMTRPGIRLLEHRGQWQRRWVERELALS